MTKTELSTESKVKLVKIRAVRDITVKGTTIKPGQEAEVSEDDAKLFCDTKYPVGYNGWGEGHYDMQTVARAVRV